MGSVERLLSRRERAKATVRKADRAVRRELRISCWLALAAGVLVAVLRPAISLDPVIFAPVAGLAIVAAILLARGWGEWGPLAAYIVTMGMFIQLRDAADETGLRTLTAYVLDWELWMFAGATPSAWLQARIGGTGSDPGIAAYASAVIHWTWFVFPHAAVIGVWLFARRFAWRAVLIMTSTFMLGALLYFTVPTAPPWMAVEQGLVGGIERVMNGVGPAMLGESFYAWAFETMAEPNPTAAMPSLHFAASFVVVGIGLLVRSRGLVLIALLYSAALAFALMYLGEHYLADIIAGGVVALIALSLVEGVRIAGAAAELRRQQWLSWKRRALVWARESLRLPPRRIEVS